MTGIELTIRCSVVVIALASVAWAAVPMARHMAGVVVLDAPQHRQVEVPLATDLPDLGALFAIAPFGRVPTPDATPLAGEDNRPNIVLRGIFASSDAASTALLDVGGVPGLYRQAMTVADGLEVSRITSERVDLTDGETTITLRFDSTADLDAQGAVAANTTPSSLLDRLHGGFVIPAAYEKPGKPQTTAEYIDYWRTRIRKNPQAVLDEIGLHPTDQGYVIADKHDVGVRLAGLRSGDLVRTVNGQAVGDPDADRRLYDEIATAGQARIEVERGGRILSLSFPLR